MDKENSSGLRKFGIDIVGSVPWGTHLCQLFRTKQDLIEIMIPYFVEALRANELCLLIASPPLGVEEAEKVLKKVIPNLDDYIKKNQIEIVAFNSIYLPSCGFRAEAIVRNWCEKEEAALSQGFDGLRIGSILPFTDNELWNKLWARFSDYSKAVNEVFSSRRILDFCGYPFEKCTLNNIIQIESHYAGTLIKREGEWFLVEDAGKRRKSEVLYKDIIQTSIDGFFIVNSQGDFLEVNRAYSDLLGYSQDELMKMCIHDVEMNETLDETMKHIQRISKEGYDRFETRHRRKDNQPVDVELSANYIENEGDGRYFVFAHNVTKRKRNEAAIRQNEARYRELADSVTDSFVALDRDLKYVYWNKACEKKTGIPAENAIGRHVFEVFTEDKGIRKIAAIYLRVLKTKKPKVFVDELTLNNRRFIVENHIYPSKTGVSVFTKDITQRMRLKGKLEEYTQRLEELVKKRTEKLKATERLAAIGETAGMVGHDIRNPLQTITGELYLVKCELTSLPDGETKRNLMESLEVIGDQMSYINKIVADLQDFARVSKPSVEDVNLEKTLNDIILTINVPEGIRVAISIQEGFPKFRSDSSYLKRIFINLLTNAVQAMPNGGKLSVKASWSGAIVKVSVEDTGQGIPEEAKEKIFRPLFTTKARGQGLGLAVVKKLTNALGGNIWFESKVGQGTRFIVEIPLRIEPPQVE